jgi:hypothetical protein
MTTDNAQGPHADTPEPEVLSGVRSLRDLDREINEPITELGKRYMAFVAMTVVASIFFLFVSDEYPSWFPPNSVQLFVVELFIFCIFTLDFILRLAVIKPNNWRSCLLLLCDALAIVPSAMVVLVFVGLVPAAHLELLVLLRLFRLMRVVKLLRVSTSITAVFGASVFSLVFGAMAAHLGLRVLFVEIGRVTAFDVYTFFDRPVLMLAVSAVGYVFGIALAITFGIVKRKQMEITEMHRTALDALQAVEYDCQTVLKEGLEQSQVDGRHPDFDGWRVQLSHYLQEELSYEAMKASTTTLLHNIRDVVHTRPSMDVPFHAVLTQRMSAFLTKTQVCFHPAFYAWLRRIANLYFVLVMLAAPGLTGLGVQLLVIFVFQGLVVIIDDMDHSVDKAVTIFNAKILEV